MGRVLHLREHFAFPFFDYDFAPVVAIPSVRFLRLDFGFARAVVPPFAFPSSTSASLAPLSFPPFAFPSTSASLVPLSFLPFAYPSTSASLPLPSSLPFAFLSSTLTSIPSSSIPLFTFDLGFAYAVVIVSIPISPRSRPGPFASLGLCLAVLFPRTRRAPVV